MLVNQSMLKTWMTCPLQAKFQYEDQLPRLQNAKASFGTCIHHALEDYNKTGNVGAAISLFKDTWAHPEKLGVEPDYWPKFTNYAQLREKGVEILKEYDEQQKWDGRTVIATEHKFCVPFGDHEISGIVDLIELKKSGNKRVLRLVDYKTNSAKPSFATLRFDIQFTAYVYASLQPEFWIGVPGTKYPGISDGADWFERTKKMNRKAIWHHLWKGQEIDCGDRDDGDYERLYRLVTQIALAKEANIYIPTISADSCLYCSYTDQCRYVLPVKEQMKKEEDERLFGDDEWDG